MAPPSTNTHTLPLIYSCQRLHLRGIYGDQRWCKLIRGGQTGLSPPDLIEALATRPCNQYLQSATAEMCRTSPLFLNFNPFPCLTPNQPTPSTPIQNPVKIGVDYYYYFDKIRKLPNYAHIKNMVLMGFERSITLQKEGLICQ